MVEKNKKTKITLFITIGVLVAIIIFVVMKYNSSNVSDDVKNPNEGDLSRYEWVEMLSNQFGMTTYESSIPYFKDVSEDNTHFNYVQSSAEWSIIEKSDEFNGNDYASGRFIVLTAMKVIGETNVQSYLDTSKKITDDEYIQCAIENNLITKEQLKQSFSRDTAEELLSNISSMYFGTFWQDDFESVEYKNNVIELKSEDILQSNEDMSVIKINSEILSDVKEQYILVFEYKNTGLKVAKKVLNIENDDTIILSQNVELSEILDSLVVSDISELSIDNIINYYNLTPTVATIKNQNRFYSNESVIMPVLSMESKNKGFKISLTTSDNKDKKILNITVTDNNTGVSYLLPLEKEIDVNSDYYAELNIDKIYTATQLKYTALTGVEYAEVALDVNSKFEGGLTKTGSMSYDKILLCETPTPLGSGIAGVDIQIYLVLSLDGTISLEAELPVNVSTRYEKNKGVRNYVGDTIVSEPTLEVNANTNLMLRNEPILVLFMTINVMDVEVDTGTSVQATAEIRPSKDNCFEILGAFPVVNVSMCSDEDVYTIVGDLGLSSNWEIVSSDDAPYQIKLHYEQLSNGVTQFVDECTYGKELTYSEELTYEALLSGDFSYFAGTYKASDDSNRAYGSGEDLFNLQLDDDGIVTGGGSHYLPDYYSKSKPISVTEQEDGSYWCQVTYDTETAKEYSMILQEYFIIYPNGIPKENSYYPLDNDFMIGTPCIRYVFIDGGVSDIIYYKID